jgi:hypothetical protein
MSAIPLWQSWLAQCGPTERRIDDDTDRQGRLCCTKLVRLGLARPTPAKRLAVTAGMLAALSER